MIDGMRMSASMRRPRPAHIPEDRHRRGLVLDLSVQENLLLGKQRMARYQRFLVQRPGALGDDARRALDDYDVRPRDPDAPARSLSGGNQQKIVLARELGREARLVLASQPTRGLDIGATLFVRSRLLRERSAGKAVLLVSSDTEELLLLSDRIAVMYGGEIVARFDTRGCTEAMLGPYMVGAARA
jgi:simple sugar transport system ATP-binding protein